MDGVQIVLLFVIVLLTILLVVLGIQVFFILKELRSTLERANRVLENTEAITESVSEPVNFLSGLLSGTKSLATVTKFLKGKKKNKSQED